MKAVVGVSANLELLHEGVILDGVEKLEPAKTTTVIAGSSVNVALALQQHDWTTHVLAAVGKNGPGNADIVAGLSAHGVGATLLPVRDATPIATVLLYADGKRHLIPSKPPVCYPAPPHAISRTKEWGGAHALRIFTGVRPDEVPLIQAICGSEDAERTVLSPNRMLIENDLLAAIRARILFLGTEEMRGFFQKKFGREQLVPFTSSMMRIFFAEYPALDLVVLTMGAEGSLAVMRNGTSVLQPAIKTAWIVDTTGCGDVFLATVLAYLYDEESTLHLDEAHLMPAMRAAAVAASLKLRRVGGSSVPSRAEVEAVLGA